MLSRRGLRGFLINQNLTLGSCPDSDAVGDYRFVIDEQAFDFNGHDETTMLKCLEKLSDVLQILSDRKETVAVRNGWEAIECRAGYDFATVLYSPDYIERDFRVYLQALLNRCVAWDDLSDLSLNPIVRINSIESESYGVAWASKNINENRAMSVVTLMHRQHQGPMNVQFGSHNLPLPDI